MTKWASAFRTWTLVFLAFRYSNYTDVYRSTKLLGGSHEPLHAAEPFQWTLYSRLPGVLGPDLSQSIRSAVYLFCSQ